MAQKKDASLREVEKKVNAIRRRVLKRAQDLYPDITEAADKFSLEDYCQKAKDEEGRPIVVFKLPGRFIRDEDALENDIFRRTLDKYKKAHAIVDTLRIYDLWRPDGQLPREHMRDGVMQDRLEHYDFRRHANGSYSIDLQIGWPGGWSHYDGANMTRDIPQEWFALPWDEFMDRFEESFCSPAFYYTRGELEAVPGLKKFLGYEE